MRDMIYDDDRWVRRLQRMDCWDDAAARAVTGKVMMRPKHASAGSRSLKPAAGASTQDKANVEASTPSLTLTGVSGQPDSQSHVGDTLLSPADGFSETSLSHSSVQLGEDTYSTTIDANSPLYMLEHTKSIRGHARHEYGRLHAAYGPFYKDALRTKNPSNAKVFRVFRDPKQQAQILKQLVRFAKGDSPLGQSQRDEKLKAMIEAFEGAVSNEFQAGIKAEDHDGRMKKYAEVLVILNGGQKAVDQFIELNPLFQLEQQFGDPADCVSPNDSNVLFVEEIHNTFYHLASACNNQISIAGRVFPPSVNVLGPLLQRVGRDIIGNYSNKLIDLAHQRSTESYLRAVTTTFAEVVQLELSLKLPSASKAEMLKELHDTNTDVFAIHFDTYLSTEQSWFKRQSDAEVTSWEHQLSQQASSLESYYMSNINRQADKRDFMSSFKQVIMMPVNVFQFGGPKTTGSNSASASQSVKDGGVSSSMEPSRVSTPMRSPSPGRPLSPLSEPPATALAAKAAIMKSRLEGINSLFSLEVALGLVHMAKTSIERIAVFALFEDRFQDDAKSRCEVVFNDLLKTVGSRHVRAGFDKAVEHLASYNPREAGERDSNQSLVVAPLAMFLELVNVGDLIQQMLDVFYEQELVSRKLTDKNDFLNPTLKAKKRFEQMLDERVAAGLNKGIEVLMAEVEYQLATTQKTEDYNPDAAGSLGAAMEIGPSSTAVSVVELLSNHTSMLVGSTDKQLLDVFNQEIGLRLYTAFCKHLKRQRVSVMGSIRLIRYAGPGPV